MVRRRTAAVLLAAAWAGSGPLVPAAGAASGIPTLKPTPPTNLTAPPARPHRDRQPHASTPPATTPSGSLPMTGADLPLELSLAGGLLGIGLLARRAGRRRRI